MCPAFVFIFNLLQQCQKTPHTIEAVRYCAALSEFQRYLLTTVSKKSVLLLERSRKVARMHNVIYSELDRLLNMLDVPYSNLIQAWKLAPVPALIGDRRSQTPGSGTKDSVLLNDSISDRSTIKIRYFESPTHSHAL